MTTIFFVHGISSRIYNYPETFETVKDKIESFGKQLEKDVVVYPCFWGDALGAKYKVVPERSISTPQFDETDSKEEQEKFLLWKKLYGDPFYEVRFLSLKKPKVKSVPRAGERTPLQQIRESLKNLIESSNEELSNLKLISGISDEIFTQAYREILDSIFYKEIEKNISEPVDEYYEALSRLLVAKAIYILKQKALTASIRWNSKLRDDLVICIYNELSQGVQRRAAIADWFKKQALLGIQSMFINPNRETITDLIMPYVGDVLVYQVNGEKIRQFIKKEIESKNINPPVVLIAHSLGGIACVDLLALQSLPTVEMLVTVGSQAPFFYEIGVLQSLLPDSQGKLPPLPKKFFSDEKKWLNIYDPKDLLSYCADKAFPEQVTDIKFDNRQPFPEAHNAYWSNEDMWSEIMRRLP